MIAPEQPTPEAIRIALSSHGLPDLAWDQLSPALLPETCADILGHAAEIDALAAQCVAEEARAAISAHLEALERAGLVVVPREPTEAMVEAFEAQPSGYRLRGRPDVKQAWRAMMSAAPTLQSRLTEIAMIAPEQPTPRPETALDVAHRVRNRLAADFFLTLIEAATEIENFANDRAAQRAAEAVDADGWLRKLADHKRMLLNFRGRRLLACRAAETLHDVITALGEDDGSTLPPGDGLPTAPSKQQKQEMKNAAAVLLRMILIFNDGHVSPQQLGRF